MGKFSFTKEERLTQEKWIRELFDKGASLKIYPFRVIHLRHPAQDFPFNQVLISVSTRNFKRAVDRNLLKRRVREAYRVQKGLLSKEPKLLIAFIYASRTIENIGKIKGGILKSLESIDVEYQVKKRDEGSANAPGHS